MTDKQELPAPFGWLIRGGGPEPVDDSYPWELRVGPDEPYCAWTYQEKKPIYDAAALTAQSAEIARLTAEVEGLRKDAERYRWLRDHSEPGICAFYLSVGEAFKGVKFARETVNEAIDAQIAAMKEQTNG